MSALSICVLLLAASVAGFDYFVTREDGRGVCVSDERGRKQKDLVPLYDLQNGVFPEEREEKWMDGWQLRHLKISALSSKTTWLSHRIVTTNGSEAFKSILKRDVEPQFLLLASNATLLWSENEDWRQGSTFRVRLGDPAQGHWAELCDQRSWLAKNEKCERLATSQDNSGAGNGFLEGRSWTYLRLEWSDQKLTLYTENDRILVEWSAPNDTEFEPQFLFGRTDSTRGVFYVPLWTHLELVEGKKENELSRTFSVGPEGNVCLDVQWFIPPHSDLGRFELLDSSNKVERQGRFVASENWRTRLNLTLGRGGKFKLRLLDVTTDVNHIGPCSPDEMKVWSPSDGCSVYEGGDAFAKPPAATLVSAKLNSSLSVDLTQEEMRKVCTALEVAPDAPPLLFSSRWGGAFKKCPSP